MKKILFDKENPLLPNVEVTLLDIWARGMDAAETSKIRLACAVSFATFPISLITAILIKAVPLAVLIGSTYLMRDYLREIHPAILPVISISIILILFFKDVVQGISCLLILLFDFATGGKLMKRIASGYLGNEPFSQALTQNETVKAVISQLVAALPIRIRNYHDKLVDLYITHGATARAWIVQDELNEYWRAVENNQRMPWEPCEVFE